MANPEPDLLIAIDQFYPVTVTHSLRRSNLKTSDISLPTPSWPTLPATFNAWIRATLMDPDDDFNEVQNESPEIPQKTKKRRLHGACDACRKKKVKCDSAKMVGNICTNCQLSNIDCTHNTPRQPKKSETQAIYIQALESKLERTMQLLREAYPDQDIEYLIDTVSNNTSENSTPDPPTMPSAALPHAVLKYPTPSSMPNEVQTVSDPSDEDLEHIDLRKQLSALSLDTVDNRFFGQSSAYMFFKHVSAVKVEATGVQKKPGPSSFKRSPYWNVRPWEMAFATSEEPIYIYPDDDLLQTLVFIYFDKFNPFYPVLHQPTFRRLLDSGEHHRNTDFGMIVLLVCACASPYSSDPRVMMPGDTSSLSAGWRFFSQVPMHRNKLVYKSTLYDLQYYALALVYLHSTSIPNTASSFLGIGMQHALEKGVHRRKPNAGKPTVEDELIKRAFWCMVSVDRYMSSFLGRPSMIKDEDFDVDYPIECDDEYWETEDPNKAFKQPPGKPSVITGFVQGLKLCEMLAFTLRTLYSTKKSKLLTGLIGNQWEDRIVAQLTASLSGWKDSLPLFLRWNPDEQNPVFFHQSAYIHATYYYIQILVHRPFLTKKSSLSFPALATCTNASRRCAEMLEVTATRGLRITTPNLIMAIVSAGLVMVLNIWGNHQSGLALDTQQETLMLQKCINVLKECERRSPMAGRFWQVGLLGELAALNQYHPTTNKRQRGLPEVQLPPVEVTAQHIPEHQSMPSRNPRFMVADPINNIHHLPQPMAMPVNDWELSNLLLIEMGYNQPQHYGYPSEVKERSHSYAFPTNGVQQGLNPVSGAPQMYNYDNSGRNSLASSNEEVLSVWYDMPANFQSGHEWDAYLASFGKV